MKMKANPSKAAGRKATSTGWRIKIPLGKNVNYPSGFDPAKWDPIGDSSDYSNVGRLDQPVSETMLTTDQIVVNLGPQHPSTHGVFRMVARLEGETVIDLEPVMGYLHRNHEKIGERNTFMMNIPFTDRLDYFNSMSNNFGYVLAVEKLMNVRVPTCRIHSGDDGRADPHRQSPVGNRFPTQRPGPSYPLLYGIEERELILDVFEAMRAHG